MAEKESIGKKLKREVVRAMLERTQGMDSSELMGLAGKDNSDQYDDIEETLNIPYVNRDEVALAMDMFKPKVPEGTELPVIIAIHGGGLTMGDRGFERPLSRRLAHLKYLVFSLEYRLAPRANVCEELDDVCAGMDLVGKMLVDHDVDFTRIFLFADSAGAYLAAYVAAMHGSPKLCEAIGHEPSRMNFAAMGLLCGMFYTNRKDPTGWMLSEQIYGEKRADEKFLKFMNPEHPEIVNNVPPAFLITSRGDFINNYTFMFHDALKKAGRPSKLVYFKDEELQHVFAITDPEHPRSIEAIDKMLAWFEEQAKLKTERRKKNSTVERKRKAIAKKIEDGSFNEQPIWSYIKKRRSVDAELLKNTALIDCTREYTYEQMFEEWDKYARVFSALNITGENHSRVAIGGAITAEPVFAFYGLNMTGAEVSMFSYPDFVPGGSWKTMLEKEKITDLLISDIMVSPELWKELQAEKEKLGLRKIILIHSKMGGPSVGPAELIFNEVNYHNLERTEGIVFMDKLIEEYKDTPIHTEPYNSKRNAMILHTSGTANGTRKPLLYTDKIANIQASILKSDRSELFEGGDKGKPTRIILNFDYSSSFGMLGAINTTFSTGNTAVVTFFGFMHPKFIRAVDYYNVEVLFVGGFIVDKWLDRDDLGDVSFVSLKSLGIGGSYIPPDKMEQYAEFFKSHGYKYEIMTGYGMSEVSGKQMHSHYQTGREVICEADGTDGIYIKDENDEQFYTANDGVRTGVLYLRADAMVGNELDGKKLFDYTEINGENYICSNDMVRVNEDGSLSYAGRMDKYFVNNDGKKFDSGIVDVQMLAHHAVDKCAVVPVLEKRIHDTVPVLYVVPKEKGSGAAESIRQAFVDVYVREKKIASDNLPVQFMIVDDIPLNTNGKLDIYRITRERLLGAAYNIVPVRGDDGELTDIRTEYVEHTSSMTAGTVPEGMDGKSSYNIFDLFNSPPPKKEASKGFGAMPFGMMPFGFGMMNNSDKPEKKKPEIPEGVKESFMKFGNRMIGKLYSARDIDFDIED